MLMPNSILADGTRPRVIYTFTNLNCYDSICPHQFFRRYVKKDIPFVSTDAVDRGNNVHAAMEQRIAGGKPLPADMRQWEPLVAPFAARQAKAELKLAVSYTFQATDFRGRGAATPFVRGKADCVLVSGTRAYLADWKTGAKPREYPFELEVGAMLLKAQFPQLTTIMGSYIWLSQNAVGKTYDLSDTNKTFRKCCEIAQRIEQDRTFEKREGPLCSWCDVLDCENNRKARIVRTTGA